MTGFSTQEMYDRIDRAERTMRSAQHRLEKFRELQPRLRELVGVFDSDDGFVHIEWSTADGLSVLDLNPRALRMPSEDLAELIRTGVRQAQQQLREQTRALLEEAGLGTGERPDFEQLQAQLREIGDETIAANRAAAADVARAQQLRRTLPF